jgi:glycosyltransferase involved in cell wall biosynthesis
MHVACLYLHYNTPDCASSARAHSVLRHLARRHPVTLLTSTLWQKRRLTHRFDWVPPGVTLHTLDVPYDNTMSAAQRLWAYLAFPAWALAKGATLHAVDVVYGISTPLTTAAAAAGLARWHRVPWTLEVRDLWPDFPVQMGAIPFAPAQRALYALEHRLYRSAARVITVSPDMTQHVRDRAPAANVSTLLPGTDRQLLERPTGPPPEALRQKHGLKGRQVILYAGTFGRANGIPTLLKAAAHVHEQHPTLTFVFAGHGHYEPDVRAAAERRTNVLLIPPQPHHRMLSWFRMADLSIVSFIDRPVLATNAPAKFFDSLSAGTPVIVTNHGWTKAFVDRHECGWYVPASQPTQLADRITDLFDHPRRLREAGARGARAARRHFDRSHYARGVASILEDTVSNEA